MSLRRSLTAVAIATLTLLSIGLFATVGLHAAGGSTASLVPVSPGGLSTAMGSSEASLGGSTSHAAVVEQVLNHAKQDRIPIEAVSLPNLLSPAATLSGGVVHPLTTVAPAPMGLGDFGVRNTTGTPVAYTIRSTSWEGTLTLDNIHTFLIDNDGPDTFGVQLNTVTTRTTVMGSSTDSFWIQNVMYYTPSQSALLFLDNIWNLSNPNVGANEPASTFYSYNGTPVGPEFYYDFGPSFTVPMPFTIHLFVNSSTTDLLNTGYGYTTIRFGYQILNGTGALEHSGVYDTVLFSSTRAIGTVPTSPFLVDGAKLTPTNFLLYDSELMIGGPGGGSTTSVYGLQGSEQLQYLNTKGAYVNDPTAWNVGTDTGESSEGISETYITPGTVQVSAGPSIPMPLWNATPGGNMGQAFVRGPISPSNSFVFFNHGSTFNESTAAWAPTTTSSKVGFVVPPGRYTIKAMMSEYDPTTVHLNAGAGTNFVNFQLRYNPTMGIYTPLYAWNNAQLAAISTSGLGTAAHPYLVENNQPGSLDPVFGEFNDYLYSVFPGILLVGTTAHVEIDHAASFNVTYPSAYDAYLTRSGLPLYNDLQIELYYTSNVVIWGAHDISGWFYTDDYGPTGYLPLANVVLWGATDSLVGDNTFVSEGSSLLLMQGTNNVVWGNSFFNGPQSAEELYNGTPVGIWAFESGDLIYNNYVDTTINAYSANTNLFDGLPQVNAENWNLSQIEPAGQAMQVDGHWLSGSIVGGLWQGGNYWSNYAPGGGLPFNDYGLVATGGDYYPLPIQAYAVVFTAFNFHHVAWSVTFNGVTESTHGWWIAFYEYNGTYNFTASVGHGSHITPASGTITINGASQFVLLRIS